jgi:hypothetical protein
MLLEFRGIQDCPEGEARFCEIQRRFLESARSIIFDYDLVFHQFCERREMRITALELYLYCTAWPDPNTDRSFEQLNQGTWYIPPDRFIDRIDITAGCRSENIYCGLLIREIALLESKAGDCENLKGPARALRHMIRGPNQEPAPFDWKWLPQEIETIDQIRGRDVLRSGPLRLCRREISHRDGETSMLPRVNLRTDGPKWTGAREPWNQPLRVVLSRH